MGLSAQMGASVPYLQFGAGQPSVNGTTLALSAGFVNATSGTAYAMRITSPVSQTSAQLKVYAFLTAKTGSPTAVKAAVFAGASGAMDPQRPDTGAALATSAAVDVSAQTDNTWTTFTISSISLTVGVTYWIVIFNDTGTPASNYPTYMTRGFNGNQTAARFTAQTTANGFTTDPSIVSGSSDALMVLAFSDGSVLGNPYAVSNAHANNTNDRGIRVRYPVDIKVVGIFTGTFGAPQSGAKVYAGAVQVASVTFDLSQKNNTQTIYFDAPVTLLANTDYDVVLTFGSNSSVFPRIDAGSGAPSDVMACFSSCISALDGTTPGSYTNESGFRAIQLLLDEIPAATGGDPNSHCFGG